MLPQPTVGALTAGCGVLAVAAAWLRQGWPRFGVSAWAIAAALALAIVIAYRFPIHVRHHTKVLLVTAAYYLMAVLLPVPLAVLAAGIGAIGGELYTRPTSGAYPSDIAAEVGRRVINVLVGAVVAHVGGALPDTAALLCTAAVLGALDALTVPLVLAPMSGELPRQVLFITLRDTAAAEAIQYAVAIVGAVAADRYVWTLALLIAPCGVLFSALKATKEMHDGTRQLLESMADAVDLRDAYTGGHSRRVTAYSEAILRALNLAGPEVDLVLTSARVHDIGKIGIPDAVLHKPGPLTPEERAVMERHPVDGATLLKRYGDFARGVAIVRHHHERWDGEGYPDGLKGTEIPFGARVIAVADSFDAMTSDRPYRTGMPVARAASILRDGRGTQWDTAIVDAFLSTLAGDAEQATVQRQRQTDPSGEPVPGPAARAEAA